MAAPGEFARGARVPGWSAGAGKWAERLHGMGGGLANRVLNRSLHISVRTSWALIELIARWSGGCLPCKNYIQHHGPLHSCFVFALHPCQLHTNFARTALDCICVLLGIPVDRFRRLPIGHVGTTFHLTPSLPSRWSHVSPKRALMICDKTNASRAGPPGCWALSAWPQYFRDR
jgi:hypothetical protein